MLVQACIGIEPVGLGWLNLAITNESSEFGQGAIFLYTSSSHLKHG